MKQELSKRKKSNEREESVQTCRTDHGVVTRALVRHKARVTHYKLSANVTATIQMYGTNTAYLYSSENMPYVVYIHLLAAWYQHFKMFEHTCGSVNTQRGAKTDAVSFEPNRSNTDMCCLN